MIVNKPPMGWNTWNTFGKSINDQLIRETADKMVSEGLLEAGYEYLVVDDCWSLHQRDAEGRLQPDPEKFPYGMKDLIDYVHSKGLKFGMYTSCGPLTCAGHPASYDHEFVDAKTFASWGVDFLKYDRCWKPYNEPCDLVYRRMGLALKNSGRDILFAACSWGIEGTPQWIKCTGAGMWRSTGDILDSWEAIKRIYTENINLQQYNGKGVFNDMDMLVVGMRGKGYAALDGCNDTEYRTHFSIWSMFASPLIIGCDIRSMDEGTREILLNKDVISINQDPMCAQPYHIDNDVWIRHLANGDIAILVINMKDDRSRFYFTLSDLGITMNAGLKFEMTDLWTKETSYLENEARLIWLEAHDCLFLRCRFVER